jgi:hypothetical protein
VLNGDSPVVEVTDLAARVGHLHCGADYQLSVRAVDIAGNVSDPATLTARTLRCR